MPFFHPVPNTNLHGIQINLNAAVRIIVNMPRYSTDKNTPRANELSFLPVKATIKFKVCLLAHKCLLASEPQCLKTVLRSVPISGLRSSSTNRLIDPFIYRQMRINRAFSHCVLSFYNHIRTFEKTFSKTFLSLSVFKFSH